jgi:23S rRNA pseudouridine955/2504/2580 synthase
MTDYPPVLPPADSESVGESTPESDKPGLRPLVVAVADRGARLLPWLRQQLPQAGFSNLNKALRSGQIRLDGKRCTGKERLEVGQLVRVPPFLRDGKVAGEGAVVDRIGTDRDAAMLANMVIARSADWVALNKPAGLAVQGGQGVSRHLDGLLPLLAEGGEKLRLVHRLDKETSGLLLVARHVGAASALAEGFRQHQLLKTYWALVWGRPTRAEGSWRAPLEKRGTGPEQRMVVDAAGQDAITHYRLLAYNQAANISWLQLQPHTGRMHQLRVHCSDAGIPIVGDNKYGAVGDMAAPNRTMTRVGAGRSLGLSSGYLYLHAYSLLLPELPDPLVAPPPAPFTNALRLLFPGGV